MRALWLASLFLCATVVDARPYTIDDMLKLEGYGAVEIDPAERWAVVERRRPYDRAPRYDLEVRTEKALSQLYLVHLDRPGGLELAFPHQRDAGYWIAGFSPSGSRLAVFRIQGNAVSLGVLDMRTRAMRWLHSAADVVEASPRPIWVDDDRLVFVVRSHGDLPVRYSSGGQRRISDESMQRSAAGRLPAVRVSGSGSYRDLGIQNDVNAIVRADLRTGEIEEIERGAISDIAISADRRKLAIVTRGPVIQPYLDRPVDPAFQLRRQRLVVEDLASGRQIEPCPSCDILPNLLAWAPHGADLLFYGRHDDQEWRQGQLYRLAGGRSRPALPPGLQPDVSIVRGGAPTVRAAWAGDVPVVLARRGTGGAAWFYLRPAGASSLPITEADQPLFASRDSLIALSGRELMRVRPGGQRERILANVVAPARGAAGDHISVGARLVLNPDLRDLLPVLVGEGATRRLLALNPQTPLPSWSVELPADAAVMAAAPGRGAVIYQSRSASGVGTLVLDGLRLDARRLDSINHHLADVDVPQRTVVRSTTADGRQLTHWLTLPAGRDPAPLVVIPYPGWDRGNGAPPPLNLAEVYSYSNVALLVAAGYAVLQPSIPTETATDRRTTDFGEQGSMTEAARVPDSFEDDEYLAGITAVVLGAVDAAIGTGRVDAQRLALYGHSYGGYAVTGIAARTNRFRAIIASAGAYNLLGSYGAMYVRDVPELGLPTGMFSWFEAGQGGLGAPPWRELQGYVGRSPYFAVERIRTPVMLIHGEMDFIPVEEAEQMFMAFHRIGRDAILLRYAGEGHALVSPANIRDRWTRILAFLETHLAPGGDQSRQ